MRRWPLVLTGLLVVSGCSSTGESTAQRSADVAAALSTTITYSVTGTAHGASITWKTPTGITQNTTAAIPFLHPDGGDVTYHFESGDFVSISAQITGEAGGDLTCAITDDAGHVISQNTASGFAAIASCDGTA